VTGSVRKTGQFIRLSHDGGNVVVEPQDEDRFVITAQSAVKACQDSQYIKQAIQRFKREFLQPVYEWCRAHAGAVGACYVPVPMAYTQVFVVGTSPKYDFRLGDELAALELKLADAGWRVQVLQIPASDEEDLRTYFNTEGAIEVYAQLATTSGQGQS
jgi:hypothetical protein